STAYRRSFHMYCAERGGRLMQIISSATGARFLTIRRAAVTVGRTVGGTFLRSWEIGIWVAFGMARTLLSDLVSFSPGPHRWGRCSHFKLVLVFQGSLRRVSHGCAPWASDAMTIEGRGFLHPGHPRFIRC